MKDREDFLKRMQNMTIEKEPRTDGFELTEKTIKEEIQKYNKVLKSEVFKKAINGEER